MKLLFVNGSRGEWGYIRPVIRQCHESGVEYSICATNMLLLAGYGKLVEEIRHDGFRVDDEIFMSLEGSNHYTMVKSLAIFLSSFVDVLYRQRPDWIILAGDRGEQLMGAVAGAYTYTPVAHIQAGELSGNIDGVSRHALGKFAHVHFASNQDAADRLQRLGEEDFRIHCVGAPQLDELVQGCFTSREQLEQQYAVDLCRPYMLVVQHPVTEEYDRAEQQIMATIQALSRFDMPKVWILPNNDAGSEIIREGIFDQRDSGIYLFQNLRREDFLGFMRYASCMVGNSSAALLEAPTFEIPAVNIGRRQAKRVQGQNVVNVDAEVEKIVAAIQRILTPSFRGSLRGCTNPYGDGRSSARILDILRNTRHDSRLLVKQLTY